MSTSGNVLYYLILTLRLPKGRTRAAWKEGNRINRRRMEHSQTKHYRNRLCPEQVKVADS
jgi:hypothetical protein